MTLQTVVDVDFEEVKVQGVRGAFRVVQKDVKQSVTGKIASSCFEQYVRARFLQPAQEACCFYADAYHRL